MSPEGHGVRGFLVGPGDDPAFEPIAGRAVDSRRSRDDDQFVLPRLLLAILLALGPSVSGHAGGDRCRCSSEGGPAAAGDAAAGPSCCDAAPEVPTDQCAGCDCAGCGCDPGAPAPGDASEGCADGCGCGCLLPATPGQIPAISSVITPVGVERAGPVPAQVALSLVRPADAAAAVRPAGGFADPAPSRAGRRRLLLDAVLRL